MKPVISLKFKNEKNVIEKVSKFSNLLINKHWDKIKKIELVPSDKDELNISIGDDLIFTKEPQGSTYDENKVLSVVEEAIVEYHSKKNKSVNCFGWDCSDHLRKTSN